MRTGHRVVVAALALLALAGCSSSGSGGADSAAAGGGDAGVESEVDGGVVDPAMDTSVTTQRQVIVTASAELQVDDTAAAADELAALATAAGGRVEAREEFAGGENVPGWASLVLRVPAEDLSEVLAGLDGLGTVVTVSQSEEDVTGAVVDLDARIESLETSTARLTEIMADADDTGDLLAVETQLSARQAELESLQQQRDALGDRVAMATLSVSVGAVPVAAIEARGGFIGGLESGWNALVAFVGWLLAALGAMLPWIVAIGVPALVVLLVRRRRRRAAAVAPAST